MEHFNPFDDCKTIDFHAILSIVRECSFFYYFNRFNNNAELAIYFDNLGKTERIIYTVYFDRKTLNISRCTEWDGKRFTKGGGNHYKVADIKGAGQKELKLYMNEISMENYGIRDASTITNLK